MPSRNRFELFKDENGEYRWRYKSRNNQITAVSGEGYTTKSGAVRALRNVRSAFWLPVTRVLDLTTGKRIWRASKEED